MLIQKPRGTKDLYGEERLRTEEICEVIRGVFIAYGYSEIKTPIFEDIGVFVHNDETLLESNKEFFQIKSRGEEEVKYVLRPENTASVVRALVEHKIVNKQVDYPLRFFYEGPYFRYERPQSGRFRQFMQMGIEKVNSGGISDDIENLLIMKEIQEKLGLKLTLKLNYIGGMESKERWNKELKEYFSRYKDELSEVSQRRICENPMRILDDKVDCNKECVKLAPRVSEYLSEEDVGKLREIKRLIEELEIEGEWDSGLVRGIDYYTGLIYEWVDEKEGLTVAAGGRYDNLFERFGYSQVPSLGLAIGIERLKMIVEREGKYVWKHEDKFLYLYPKKPVDKHYITWVFNLRRYLVENKFRIRCVASYEYLDLEKHKKLCRKMCVNGVLLGGECEEKEVRDIVNQIYGV